MGAEALLIRRAATRHTTTAMVQSAMARTPHPAPNGAGVLEDELAVRGRLRRRDAGPATTLAAGHGS